MDKNNRWNRNLDIPVLFQVTVLIAVLEHFFPLPYVLVYVFAHVFKISAERRLEDSYLNHVSVSRQIRCFSYPKYLVQMK